MFKTLPFNALITSSTFINRTLITVLDDKTTDLFQKLIELKASPENIKIENLPIFFNLQQLILKKHEREVNSFVDLIPDESIALVLREVNGVPILLSNRQNVNGKLAAEELDYLCQKMNWLNYDKEETPYFRPNADESKKMSVNNLLGLFVFANPVYEISFQSIQNKFIALSIFDFKEYTAKLQHFIAQIGFLYAWNIFLNTKEKLKLLSEEQLQELIKRNEKLLNKKVETHFLEFSGNIEVPEIFNQKEGEMLINYLYTIRQFAKNRHIDRSLINGFEFLFFQKLTNLFGVYSVALRDDFIEKCHFNKKQFPKVLLTEKMDWDFPEQLCIGNATKQIEFICGWVDKEVDMLKTPSYQKFKKAHERLMEVLTEQRSACTEEISKVVKQFFEEKIKQLKLALPLEFEIIDQLIKKNKSNSKWKNTPDFRINLIMLLALIMHVAPELKELAQTLSKDKRPKFDKVLNAVIEFNLERKQNERHRSFADVQYTLLALKNRGKIVEFE